MIVFLLCCCLLPIFLIGLVFVGSIFSAFTARGNNYAVGDYWRSVWDWLNILTIRSILTLSVGGLFMLISYAGRGQNFLPFTVISTMGVFAFTLASVYILIAFLAKLSLSLRSLVLPVSDVALSKTELNEGEANVLKVGLKSFIPPGYILRISEQLPLKLGGEMRAVATKTTAGKAEFEATIPYSKRGQYIIGPTRYSYMDVFGMSKINVQDNSRFQITILPEIPFIRRFEFKLAPQKGDQEMVVTSILNTEEHYATRPYVRGDDVRRLHWKLTAKSDELILRVPETTTITYKDLSIVLLNTMPLVDSMPGMNSNVPTTLNLKYRQAAEYALDHQIKVASALADFALRAHIPVSLYYFTKRGLERFTPTLDAPSEWKHILAQIELIQTRLDLSLVDEVIKDGGSCVVTSSELNLTRISPLIENARKNNAQLEIMYSPISDQVKYLVESRATKEKRNWLTSSLSKILLTKPYFEQTTIFEKISDMMGKTEVKYNESDMQFVLEKEKMFIASVGSTGYAMRDFYRRDNFVDEKNNIVNILENE